MKYLKVLEEKVIQTLRSAFVKFSERYKKTAPQEEERVILATFVLKIVVGHASHYLCEAAQLTEPKKVVYEQLLAQELEVKKVNPNSSILPDVIKNDSFLTELIEDFQDLFATYLFERQLARELVSGAVISDSKIGGETFKALSSDEQLRKVSQRINELRSQVVKYSRADNNPVAQATARASIKKAALELKQLQNIQADILKKQRTINQENQDPRESKSTNDVGFFQLPPSYGKSKKPALGDYGTNHRFNPTKS